MTCFSSYNDVKCSVEMGHCDLVVVLALTSVTVNVEKALSYASDESIVTFVIILNSFGKKIKIGLGSNLT